MSRSRQVKAEPRSFAYLLRCWEEAPGAQSEAGAWRFSLEDPHSGVRRGFATLAALVAALEARLEEPPRHDRDAPRGAAREAEKE